MDRMSLPAAQKRVGLPPFEDMKKEVRDQLLDPVDGLEAELAMQLRSALGLPAPSADGSGNELGELSPGRPSTNAPAGNIKSK
jgi:hypothetical protein